jgi:Fe-S cluster assembly protein SufB
LNSELLIDDLNFDKIRYYLANNTGSQHSGDDVSPEGKTTFDRLGIPGREPKFIAGIEAQFDSEATYNRIQEALANEGGDFC